MSTSQTESSHGMSVSLEEAVTQLISIEEKRGERLFVVGGVVRDLLMQRGTVEHDLDVVVEGDGLEVARELSGLWNCTVVEHRQFLTAKIRGPFPRASLSEAEPIDEVDIATARLETYERPGALPTVSPSSIEQDLWRRDFSINSIALPLTAYQKIIQGASVSQDISRRVIDPAGGVNDIQGAVLRVLHPKSFIDDPTRLFRAVRYLVRLGFHFDMPTLAGFVEAVKSGCLTTLTPRRVWNEVLVTLHEQCVTDVLQEFIDRELFSDLPIIDGSNSSWVMECLERLAHLRKIIGTTAFQEAAKLLLLANLIRSGRQDVAHAVHEGRRSLKRAQAVLDAEKNVLGVNTVSEVAAAYSAHCSEVLRQRLKEVVRRAA